MKKGVGVRMEGRRESEREGRRAIEILLRPPRPIYRHNGANLGMDAWIDACMWDALSRCFLSPFFYLPTVQELHYKFARIC